MPAFQRLCLKAAAVFLLAFTLPGPGNATEEPPHAASPPNALHDIGSAYDPRLPDLKVLPLAEIVYRMSLGLNVRLIVDGRERFLQELARLSPLRRRLQLIDTIDQNWGRDGLHTFFFLIGGDVAPEIEVALKEAGMEREHHLFALAVRMFGSPYPVDEKSRDRFFGWSKPGGDLNVFDKVLMGLAREFGTQADYLRAIEAYVRAHRDVLALVEAERERLPDDDRLDWLEGRLAKRVPLRGSRKEIDAALDALPQDYRTLFVLGTFMDEFMNGGIHQFFLNSSGDIAPRVPAALRAVGLPRQAAVIERCLDFFPKPYPVERAARHSASFAETWGDWDKRLSAMTDAFWAIEDAGIVRSRELAFAKAKGLLPH